MHLLADGSEFDVRPFTRHSTGVRSASQTVFRSLARTRASLAGVVEVCIPLVGFRTGKFFSSHTKGYRSVLENVRILPPISGRLIRSRSGYGSEVRNQERPDFLGEILKPVASRPGK
jgi:hypothetical protein